MMTRTRLLQMRSIAMGLVAIGATCVAIANLYCAAAYSAVFLHRGMDWVSIETNRVAFLYSVVMSLLAAPAFAGLGVAAIRGVREERRYNERLACSPSFGDPSKTSRL